MKILFITRNFPPAIGGMEKVAFELFLALSQKEEVILLKWTKKNKFFLLIGGFPFLTLKASWILLKKEIDIIFIQDGILAPLGVFLKFFFKKPVFLQIHGLDITYPSKIYQFFIPQCLKYLTKIICVSELTKKECLKRKISLKKMIKIPNGISSFGNLLKNASFVQKKLEKKFSIKLKEKKILLSVGRLIERKGICWFLEEVMPELLKKRENFLYLIVGEGPLKEKMAKIIEKKSLQNHVKLLGKVSERMLAFLYSCAHIFILPNIPIKGDLEGFGIVALEAASLGTPVLVTKATGIATEKNFSKREGFYILNPKDTKGFVKIIEKILKEWDDKKRKKLAQFVICKYSWEKIAQKFIKVFQKAIHEK